MDTIPHNEYDAEIPRSNNASLKDTVPHPEANTEIDETGNESESSSILTPTVLESGQPTSHRVLRSHIGDKLRR